MVDSGLSKGKTMATVAKERPVSLKFYLTPGNKSTNNIVRAAAQIMLDGMAAQKATVSAVQALYSAYKCPLYFAFLRF